MNHIYYKMLGIFSSSSPLPPYFNKRCFSDQFIIRNIISNTLLCFSDFTILLLYCSYFKFVTHYSHFLYFCCTLEVHISQFQGIISINISFVSQSFENTLPIMTMCDIRCMIWYLPQYNLYYLIFSDVDVIFFNVYVDVIFSRWYI